VSLEDAAVSSTASDPDIAVFEQQTVAGGAGPEDEDDEDEVSEARSAPPVFQHDRAEMSEEDGVEQSVPEVDTLLLLLLLLSVSS